MPEDPESVEAARLRAIGMLARRDLPRAALSARLADAGFAATAAESAVAALEDERLVDDTRYVEAAVASRIGRGQGPLRIALELRRQGVDPERVAPALAARAAEWAGLAAGLRCRRFGARAPAGPAERLRQMRFLLYRGFTGAQVRAALGGRFEELPEDAELDPAGSDGDATDPG